MDVDLHAVGEENANYLPEFRDEISDRLQSLTGVLMQLESAPADRALVVAGFREAHTIKGLAGVVGLSDAQQLSHGLEDVFSAARDARLPLSDIAFDILFQAIDRIYVSLDAPLSGPARAEMEEQLQAVMRSTSRGGGNEADDRQGTGFVTDEVVSDLSTLQACPDCRDFPMSRFDPPEPPERIERRDRRLVAASTRRDWKQTVVRPRADLIRVSAEELTQISRLARAATARQVRRRHLLGRLREVADSLPGMDADLESLCEMAAAIERTPIISSAISIRAAYRKLRTELQNIVVEHDLLTTESDSGLIALEETLVHLQFVPLRSLFDVFPRMIRDMARADGKDVQLRLMGSELSMERRIVEHIRAPLVHLLRNAVSHGIELPDERERLGKSRSGLVSVDAYRAAGKICIEVSDDGSGIDHAELKEKARERGIVGRASDEQNGEQSLALIFRSGFTTREVPDSAAGRGIGLDMVRSRVADVHGTVWIASEPGRGTTFVIKIPSDRPAVAR